MPTTSIDTGGDSASSFTGVARPTIAGSPPKRRCHSPWLITIARGCMPTSSAAARPRPSRGRTATTLKNDGETAA